MPIDDSTVLYVEDRDTHAALYEIAEFSACNSFIYMEIEVSGRRKEEIILKLDRTNKNSETIQYEGPTNLRHRE